MTVVVTHIVVTECVMASAIVMAVVASVYVVLQSRDVKGVYDHP